jgi:hypothetical protein
MFHASAGNDLQLAAAAGCPADQRFIRSKNLEFVDMTAIPPDNMKQKNNRGRNVPVNSATFTNKSHYFKQQRDTTLYFLSINAKLQILFRSGRDIATCHRLAPDERDLAVV